MIGKTLLAAAAATGTGLYLLHPEKGRERRTELRQRAAAIVRRGGTQVMGEATHARNTAKGAVASAASTVTSDNPAHNDADLAHRVRTQAIGVLPIPAGSVNVNAEMEIVYLRGEVADPTVRETLIQAAEAVEGVRHVESLLHLPGEQPATKHETPAETRRRVGAQVPPR